MNNEAQLTCYFIESSDCKVFAFFLNRANLNIKQ